MLAVLIDGWRLAWLEAPGVRATCRKSWAGFLTRQ
jgi:hypothetical protein